ncbi:unnamed protein product [Rotaria sordida]|uniref:Uncharacterized protein n=1 Tax=Rotaria sordida TaxID=392033 RepID=A0A814MMR0_9BILA|nr:unnamed protein product [Rotaria sordida]
MGQTYILVVTTHISSEIGSFSVSADGPGSVGLTSITPSTSQPIITLSTAPPMSSSFAGALSSSSPIFYRPNITTHSDYETGSFSISAIGPASVGLMSITPSTSRPIVTPSTAPSVSSLYAGTLSSSSPVFIRPNSVFDDYSYFQAIQQTTFVTCFMYRT